MNPSPGLDSSCPAARSVGIQPCLSTILANFIAEKYPDRFAAWILGDAPGRVHVLKTELSIEPIRADSLVFLETQDRILHLEFQTRLPSDPPIKFRMLDYWVRLYRQYQVPIIQVVIV